MPPGFNPMRVLGLLALIVLASACRIEPDAPPSEPEAERTEGDVSDSETAAVPDPPVAAGDTTRVTPETAGRPDADAYWRPFIAASGLAIPVVGVEAEDLIDTFTASRSEGRSHDAIDILAPRATPVVAAADGEVVRLFTSERGGLTVYQIGDAPAPDGRRLVYYYAHLDAYAAGLEAGRRLRRGDVVGEVGDTGNAAPGNTHLHFAIWTVADAADFWDGEPVNPYPLLAAR